MSATLTLEYWKDEGWLVGRLKEVPGVFSQGETLEELESNIRDAYRLVLEDGRATRGWAPGGVRRKKIEVGA